MATEDETGQGGLPAGFEVGRVVASDAAGWVIGREAGAGTEPAQLWRIGADGTQTRAAELPWPSTPQAAGVDDGVALAGIGCDEPADRAPDGPCDHATAAVYFHGTDGQLVEQVILWEDDDPQVGSAGLGGGLWIIGSSRDTVWVRGDDRIFWKAPLDTRSRTR